MLPIRLRHQACNESGSFWTTVTPKEADWKKHESNPTNLNFKTLADSLFYPILFTKKEKCFFVAHEIEPFGNAPNFESRYTRKGERRNECVPLFWGYIEMGWKKYQRDCRKCSNTLFLLVTYKNPISSHHSNKCSLLFKFHFKTIITSGNFQLYTQQLSTVHFVVFDLISCLAPPIFYLFFDARQPTILLQFIHIIYTVSLDAKYFVVWGERGKRIRKNRKKIVFNGGALLTVIGMEFSPSRQSPFRPVSILFILPFCRFVCASRHDCHVVY